MVFDGLRSIVDVLCSTLADLEQSEALSEDEPAVLELRGSLVRTLAELSILQTGITAEPSVALPAARDLSTPVPAEQEPPVLHPGLAPFKIAIQGRDQES